MVGRPMIHNSIKCCPWAHNMKNDDSSSHQKNPLFGLLKSLDNDADNDNVLSALPLVIVAFHSKCLFHFVIPSSCEFELLVGESQQNPQGQVGPFCNLKQHYVASAAWPIILHAGLRLSKKPYRRWAEGATARIRSGMLPCDHNRQHVDHTIILTANNGNNRNINMLLNNCQRAQLCATWCRHGCYFSLSGPLSVAHFSLVAPTMGPMVVSVSISCGNGRPTATTTTSRPHRMGRHKQSGSNK